MRKKRVLSGDGLRDAPQGAVPLAAAIEALRDELTRAWWDGRNQKIRFKPSPVELSLQVGVTSAGKGSAGVKWWLIELGGELSRQSVVTQMVKLSLEPRMFDEETGKPLKEEVFIDAPDESGGSSTAESERSQAGC